MPVPLLDLRAQNTPLEAEFRSAFDRVLASGAYVLGPEVEALEKEVCAFTGARHALALTSGTDAILLALMALRIGPGDEVIVPPFTFFATAGCVARVGATPVFADIDPATYCLDLAAAERAITPRTKAIMPVNLYGQCARLEEFRALCDRRGLALVEDSAQSLGALRNSKASGTIGHFGTFSFYPTKNLGALGDGGMIVGNDDALMHKARLLRVHGMEKVYYHQMVGANFRMAGITAALLRVKLPHLPEWNRRRDLAARRYLAGLSKVPGVAMSDGDRSGAKLILPAVDAGNTHIWHQFTIRVPGTGRRDALKAFLGQRGIGCGVYYPLTLDRQECFAGIVPSGSSFPVAWAVSEECLSLPVGAELTDAQIGEVIAALSEFVLS